jgi:hypothetical protein
MAETDFNPVTESFSAGYDMVHNAEVITYDDEEAIMDYDMLEALEERFGRPLVGFIGGLHYQFKPERSIPPASVAVPKDNHDRPSSFLVRK